MRMRQGGVMLSALPTIKLQTRFNLLAASAFTISKAPASHILLSANSSYAVQTDTTKKLASVMRILPVPPCVLSPQAGAQPTESSVLLTERAFASSTAPESVIELELRPSCAERGETSVVGGRRRRVAHGPRCPHECEHSGPAERVGRA